MALFIVNFILILCCLSSLVQSPILTQKTSLGMFTRVSYYIDVGIVILAYLFLVNSIIKQNCRELFDFL